MTITKDDLEDLKLAKYFLENQSLAIKITNYLGTPIEKGFGLLPEKWSEKINVATQSALKKALKFAIASLNNKNYCTPSNFSHKLMAAGSGGIGGAFGLYALALELPVSTTIMLRSIAEIAVSEGEQIDDLMTKMACLEVFAFGGSSGINDASETGYFVVRALLGKSIGEAAEYLTGRGLFSEGAPVIVRLISNIASRFGIVVSEKAAAQAIPIIGAVSGATINTIFMDHFQKIAHGHFTIRRLERTYNPALIRSIYTEI